VKIPRDVSGDRLAVSLRIATAKVLSQRCKRFAHDFTGVRVTFGRVV
jgi:hypothetical protein